MKVAIVGCGAVGSYYGGRLSLAGHDVHFLLRSDYEQVKRQGLILESNGQTLEVRPIPARDPVEIGPADLVLIALKTTANAEFARLLPPLINESSAVMTLQNGLGNEEHLATLFERDQILGGLCFVCLNRVAPGVIRHLAHGQIVMGEFAGRSRERTRLLAGYFNEAGVPCAVTDDLQKVHWEKLVWNVPFNGLGVAGAAGWEAATSGCLSPGQDLGPCLTTDKLLGNARWAKLVRELMDEVIAAANGVGCEVLPQTAELQIERTRTMGPYKASTLIDFERGQPLELEGMFLEPLRRAHKAGIATPRLRALSSVLTQMAALLST